MGILWPDATHIRTLRKKLGLTQKALAEIAFVDQSAISKIEAGEIADPSYYTVRRLFSVLHNLENTHGEKRSNRELVAQDLMNRNVVSATPSDRIKDARAIMKQKGFSQLPVIDNNRILGGIRDSELLLEDGDRRVREVIGEAFPIVGLRAGLSMLAAMVRENHAVLVIDKGNVAGIITAHDLIQNTYDKEPNALK